MKELIDRRPEFLGLMLLFLFLESACGFKLRGAVEIPPNFIPVYVETSGSSTVGAILKERFQISGVQQATSPKDAHSFVRILSEARTSRVGALDSNGKIIATDLLFNLRFDARDASGKVLVEPRALEISRIYENADVEVLGKQLEAEILYSEMAQDAATQILAMLRAALSSS
jgi:LPS-assembly lipoprotein